MSNTKDENFEQFYASATQSQIKALVYAAWNDGSKVPETVAAKKVLELKGGPFYINSEGRVYNTYAGGVEANAGIQRATRELAEKAARKRVERDRLAAWVAEHSGEEYEFVRGVKNAFLFQERNGAVKVSWDTEIYALGKIYMPLATAEWLREKLNAGEIVL